MGPTASPDAKKWTYENQTKWKSEYRECGGVAQSPIDIQRRNVIQNSQLKLKFYNYYQPARFNLENKHHTIELSPISPEEPIENLKKRHESPPRVPAANEQVPAKNEPNIGEDEPEFETGLLAGSDPFLKSPSSASGFGRARDDHSTNVLGRGDEHHQPLQFDGSPGIKLDWMDDGNNEFTLRNIHFHWGERKDNGSEHAIDGRRAAMEVSLV